MHISVKYEDTQNEYEFPIGLLAKEIGLSDEQIEQAVMRVLEKT